MILLRGVSKRFGAVEALQPIDLEIDAGRTTVLIGPSGCGKSTLLRLLAGLLRPDAGEILCQGQALEQTDIEDWRRRLGYVIQDGGLFPHMTGRQNAALMARHLGWDDGRVETRLRELLELTRLPADALERYPAELSGGQRQRVALMRALMLDPPLLLLDEPLGALDPMVRAGLQADLREIFRRLGKTVVLVTHDMGEAAFLGDAIVLLRQGRLLQRGGLEDLLERPADPFVSRFINAQRSLLGAAPEGGA